MRLRTAAVALAVALAAALAPGASAETQPPSPAPSVLAPVSVIGSSAPAPTARGVEQRIGGLLKKLGTVSALVVDPATGEVLLRQGRSGVPASTMKLLTAAAALKSLGANRRLATTVQRSGSTITLVGGGDATLVEAKGKDPLAGGSASLATLADATVKALGTERKVTLVYDDSLFTGPQLGPGWSAGFPRDGVAAPVSALMVDSGRVGRTQARTQDPALAAARAFAAQLRVRGIAVQSIKRGNAVEGSAEIARVESAPVADLVERMLTDSDNDLAEALAHLVGQAQGYQASFRGGAKGVADSLESLGFDPAGARIADGSGLSRRNSVPAALLAEVLTAVSTGETPGLGPIASGLPVAGATGTLADRFLTGQTSSAAGIIRAKTGTLTGVVALAGTVVDADGRLLVFVVLADGVRSVDAARLTVDQIAWRLAGCGCT